MSFNDVFAQNILEETSPGISNTDCYDRQYPLLLAVLQSDIGKNYQHCYSRNIHRDKQRCSN
jgi:hypothetical protein